jgi:stage V sporulation protein SpoVS
VLLAQDKLDFKVYTEFYSPAENGEEGGLNQVVRFHVLPEPAEPPRNKAGSLLRAGPNSNPRSVAGAIANNVRSREPCAISTGGNLSTAVAVKALTIARDYLVEDNVDICFAPQFTAEDTPEMQLTIHIRK